MEWLDWARKLAATAQNGLEYADNAYDVARYQDVRAIAGAMLAAGGAGPIEPVLEALAREQGYATPKVDVRALVVDQDRVLLVRERVDGRWSLPGGWADPTDQPSVAAEREVAEEAGYRVRANRLLACWDRNLMPDVQPYPFRVYKLFFGCELLGETEPQDLEIEEIDWFPPEALPPLSLGRVNPDQIHRLLTLAADPAAPAAFD